MIHKREDIKRNERISKEINLRREFTVDTIGTDNKKVAEFVPLDPAGDYSRDWAGYQTYLLAACDGENAFPDDEMRQRVKGQIAAATEADYDVTVFPCEMLVGMHIAVSCEDFLEA